MEQIKIVKITSKTTKNSKPYKMCEVEVNGEIRKVNIWSNAPDFANLQEGSILTGKMTMEGQYWNISFNEAKPQGGAYKTAQIEKVMETKRQDISKFQDNKEYSIKVASTLRMAVDVATALTPDQRRQYGEEGTMQETIRFWREWFLAEWDNVGKAQPFND